MEIPREITAITSVFFVACWAADLRTRSIPNSFSGLALLAGLSLNFFYGSFSGLTAAVVGAIATGGLLVPPYALGGVGGGDVKMMAAFGALVGPTVGLLGLAVGMILGGVFAVAHLARIGRLGEKLASTWNLLSGAWRQRTAAALSISAEAPDAVALPYSLPLGIGSLAVLLLLQLPRL